MSDRRLRNHHQKLPNRRIRQNPMTRKKNRRNWKSCRKNHYLNPILPKKSCPRNWKTHRKTNCFRNWRIRRTNCFRNWKNCRKKNYYRNWILMKLVSSDKNYRKKKSFRQRNCFRNMKKNPGSSLNWKRNCFPILQTMWLKRIRMFLKNCRRIRMISLRLLSSEPPQ